MNIRLGMRRIAISLIGIITVFALLIYITASLPSIKNNFSYDTIVYNKNAADKNITLGDFLVTYYNYEDPYIECYPYKQYCVIEKYHKTIKQGEVLTINKQEVIVKMPSRFEYIKTQILPLFWIIFGAFFAYGLYMCLEILVTWIIKGLKS